MRIRSNERALEIHIYAYIRQPSHEPEGPLTFLLTMLRLQLHP